MVTPVMTVMPVMAAAHATAGRAAHVRVLCEGQAAEAEHEDDCQNETEFASH